MRARRVRHLFSRRCRSRRRSRAAGVGRRRIRRRARTRARSPRRPTARRGLSDWTAESEGCLSTAAVSGFDDSGATLAAGESDGTDNLTLLSNTPKPAPFDAEGDFNSDLAFENGYAFGGNYDGVQIWDVRDGQTPALASSIHCPGSQNDVTVNDGILVTSTDSRRNERPCDEHGDDHAEPDPSRRGRA